MSFIVLYALKDFKDTSTMVTLSFLHCKLFGTYNTH